MSTQRKAVFTLEFCHRDRGGNPPFLGGTQSKRSCGLCQALFSACSRQRHIGPLMVYKPTASSWQIPVTHSVTQTGNGPASRNT